MVDFYPQVREFSLSATLVRFPIGSGGKNENMFLKIFQYSTLKIMFYNNSKVKILGEKI